MITPRKLANEIAPRKVSETQKQKTAK